MRKVEQRFGRGIVVFRFDVAISLVTDCDQEVDPLRTLHDKKRPATAQHALDRLLHRQPPAATLWIRATHVRDLERGIRVGCPRDTGYFVPGGHGSLLSSISYVPR